MCMARTNADPNFKPPAPISVTYPLGQPTLFQWAVMRSFPPPILSSSPYSGTVQSACMRERERNCKCQLDALGRRGGKTATHHT